jgi:DNA-binding response OmpR family regulator
MLTAKTQDFTVSYATRVGADDYIMKPFSPTDVLTRLKAVREKKAE